HAVDCAGGAESANDQRYIESGHAFEEEGGAARLGNRFEGDFGHRRDLPVLVHRLRDPMKPAARFELIQKFTQVVIGHVPSSLSFGGPTSKARRASSMVQMFEVQRKKSPSGEAEGRFNSSKVQRAPQGRFKG